MSGSQFGSWEDAASHPWRTLGLGFVVVAVVAGVGSYYDGWAPRSVWASAVIGVVCGIVVVGFGWDGSRRSDMARITADGDVASADWPRGFDAVRLPWPPE